MQDNAGERGVREAVAVFDSASALEDAIDDLLLAGFERADLSLLANVRTVEEKLGHRYRKVSELEDDPQAPRMAYVSRQALGNARGGLIGGLLHLGAVAGVGGIVVTGGPLAAAIAGAMTLGGVGALIGGVLARMVGESHASYLQEQLERGGLLLWVRTPDAEHERRAVDILSRRSARDVHLHTIAAG